VDPPERAKFVTHTRVDMLFLAAYTALFGALALHALRGHWRWMVAGLAIAAGIADAGENVAILRVLPLERGFENLMAQAIRQWSLAKWALLGLVWVALGAGQFRQPVAGGLYVVAGALTLWGCLEHRWLEVAFLPLTLALLRQVRTYWPSKAATSLRSRSTASGSLV
jgi:hypothetical protein